MPFSVAVNLMAFGDLFTLMPFNGGEHYSIGNADKTDTNFAAKRIIIVRWQNICCHSVAYREECCVVHYGSYG